MISMPVESTNNKKFRPYVEIVKDILETAKTKERYIEELNTTELPDISRVLRNKLQSFESLLKSAPEENSIRFTPAQKQLLEQVVEDVNRAIEADNLKSLEASIKDLESFSERISRT